MKASCDAFNKVGHYAKSMQSFKIPKIPKSPEWFEYRKWSHGLQSLAILEMKVVAMH